MHPVIALWRRMQANLKRSILIHQELPLLPQQPILLQQLLMLLTQEQLLLSQQLLTVSPAHPVWPESPPGYAPAALAASAQSLTARPAHLAASASDVHDGWLADAVWSLASLVYIALVFVAAPGWSSHAAPPCTVTSGCPCGSALASAPGGQPSSESALPSSVASETQPASAGAEADLLPRSAEVAGAVACGTSRKEKGTSGQLPGAAIVTILLQIRKEQRRFAKVTAVKAESLSTCQYELGISSRLNRPENGYGVLHALHLSVQMSKLVTCSRGCSFSFWGPRGVPASKPQSRPGLGLLQLPS
ncbi:MAG: hypothetical protein FRX49_04589 [Trebouxia sp. A1-2]|nr:MAG: hypothetical protein FRX49_04589 [Trebouxia sp. A1-2]